MFFLLCISGGHDGGHVRNHSHDRGDDVRGGHVHNHNHGPGDDVRGRVRIRSRDHDDVHERVLSGTDNGYPGIPYPLCLRSVLSVPEKKRSRWRL